MQMTLLKKDEKAKPTEKLIKSFLQPTLIHAINLPARQKTATNCELPQKNKKDDKEDKVWIYQILILQQDARIDWKVWVGTFMFKLLVNWMKGMSDDCC